MAGNNGEKVVLTGCGWVTPFASGSPAEVLTVAQTAPPTPSESEHFWSIPDALRDRYDGFSKEIRGDKSAWITAAAFEHATRHASLDLSTLNATRIGMVIGSGLAGQLGMLQFACEVRAQSPRFVSPIHFPQTVGNYLSGALARGYKLQGPTMTLASGVASGLDAIISAWGLLRGGEADVVVAGGTDVLTEAWARGAMQPGIRMSEGACLFVMERAEHAKARGAKPLATLLHAEQGAEAAGPIEGAPSDILSVAGVSAKHAITIEHWIGRCAGALSAGAVAAGISAAQGLAIPVTGDGGSGGYNVRRSTAPTAASTGAVTTVRVIADTEGAHRSTLKLAAEPS